MLDLYNKINYNGSYLSNITQFYTITQIISAKYSSIFIEYTINNWRSIENIAYDFYGSCDEYWAVIVANNIINPFEDWLLSDTELRNKINNKYNDPTEIHHYEYNGIKSNTPFPFAVPITNFQYESDLNDKKRNILLIRPELLNEIKKEAKKYFAQQAVNNG